MRARLKAINPDSTGAEIAIMEIGSMHTEPQPPKGAKESRDLVHCHPELTRRYEALASDFRKETGRDLFPTCTWRSKERQLEIYMEGRGYKDGEIVVTDQKKIKTKLDGFHKKSRHNVYPSEAVDVAVDTDPGPGKHVVWDTAAYAPLGPLALKHGLVWGGDWNRNGTSKDESFVDAPHLELPADAV